MRCRYKDEYSHKHGPWRVVAYTDIREPSNGCVKWEVACECGYTKLINGNNLRFKRYGACPQCGRRD